MTEINNFIEFKFINKITMKNSSEIIEAYKKYIKENGFVKEIYKWKLVKQNSGKPNLDAANLYEEIKSIDFSNLIYYAAKSAALQMAVQKPKEYLTCLKVLFDEAKDLKERIDFFSEEALNIYRNIEPDDKLSSHHDERTMSILLTFKYPDKYTVYKHSFYKKYCDFLGIDSRSKNEKYIHYLELIDDLIENYIKPDTELLTLVNQIHEQEGTFEDKHFKLLAQDILFSFFDSKRNEMEIKKVDETSVKYWLYAPGEGANRWEAFYEQGIMAIGWDNLGDLKQYSTKEAIEQKLQDLYKTDKSKKNDATANDDFCNIMSIGDIVIVKKGIGELLGYGVVTSDYIFDNDRGDYKSCRKVDWKLKGSWNAGHTLAVKTLTDITTYTTEHPDFDMYYERLLATMGVLPYADKIQKPTIMHTLNQILYGPPGTGKTYRTRQIAYEIIKGEQPENNKAAIQLFKELKGEQIEFVTFHQNYSYEDFVQGLRPNTEDNQGLSFKLHNGIFYKIAKRAKENYLKSINSTKEIEVSFEDVFDELCKPLENDEEVAIQMKQAVFHITNIDGNRIEFRKQSGGTGHVLLIPVLKSLYLETTKYSKAGLGVYYNPLVDELRRVADEFKSNIQPEPLKNYVLIIDEINRANISRVFGELITLLEPSKRFGQDEELEVQLPSGDRFVVPPNLYVIGTMNTADKSIALLDIALRRRFDFVPVFPDMKWVDDKYRSFFDALNTKIAEMKSPDFTIGHSYFMEINGEEGIEKVMNNKVIPLLSEYFMNDLERVKSLLASVGVKIKTEHYGILRFESIDLSKTQKNGND
jgi:5-methylcytosine-specific restriction protein B